MNEVIDSKVTELIEIRDKLAPVLSMLDLIQATANSEELIKHDSVACVAGMTYEALNAVINQIDDSIERNKH